MNKEALLAAIDFANRWGIGFCIAAAIGAIGLAVVAYRNWGLGNRLQSAEADEQRAHETALAAATTEAKNAVERAAEANERAATANERAEEAQRANADLQKQIADANERAEQERLARVKIEEKLAPRSLSAEQVADIARKLQPFAGTKLQILCIAEPEPVRLANRLIDALKTAGWRFSSSAGNPQGGTVEGVSIGLLPDADDAARTAAGALADAVRATGLTTHGPGGPNPFGWTSGGEMPMRDAKIQLVIGLK